MKRKNVPIVSFVETLQSIAQGGFVEDIQDKVRVCTRKVVETNKPGTVTITLKISPSNPNKSTGQIKIDEKVQTVCPHIPDSTLFWATDDGDLTRSNPDQIAFAMETE